MPDAASYFWFDVLAFRTKNKLVVFEKAVSKLSFFKTILVFISVAENYRDR